MRDMTCLRSVRPGAAEIGSGAPQRSRSVPDRRDGAATVASFGGTPAEGRISTEDHPVEGRFDLDHGTVVGMP
jgi:hypothetical protein